MGKIQKGIRFDEEMIEKINEIAKIETEKIGYEITFTNIVERALREFVEKFEKKSK